MEFKNLTWRELRIDSLYTLTAQIIVSLLSPEY